MSVNLIQFAPLFNLIGAKLNLVTESFNVEVVEYPVGKKTLIERAVNDIDRYVDVKTDEDVILFFGLVDFVDADPNPLTEKARSNIINLSPLVRDGKFIAQEIASLKTNKSWHISESANNCSYFGVECTNRGIDEIKGKRGRKATRSPNEYHALKSNGQIAREQLTTSPVEALWRAVPKEVMVSSTKQKMLYNVEEIKKLSSAELEQLLAAIKESQNAVND